MSAGAKFVYDADCGFCTRFATWVARHVDGRVDVVAGQRLADPAAVGLSLDDIRASSWFITPDGVRLGHDAGVAAALVAAGGAWRVVGRLLRNPLVAAVARPAYALIARNRHRMPGGSPSCRL